MIIMDSMVEVYNKYVLWCTGLGITPATYAIYYKVNYNEGGE